MNWNDCKNKINIKSGYVVAMFTDKFEFYSFDENTENILNENFEKKLIDMRIFNKDKECRIFRGDIGSKFYFRDSDDYIGNDYYDDEQYLDIDTKHSIDSFKNSGIVKAIGGGSYKLPFCDFNDIKICIRNYIDYNSESGQAYIKDWRLVDLKKEQEDKNA